MSWWELFTDKGRSLTTVEMKYEHGEMRFTVWGLKKGESVACALDHLKNKVILNAPFEECKRILALHNYDLVHTLPEELAERTMQLIDEERRVNEVACTIPSMQALEEAVILRAASSFSLVDRDQDDPSPLATDPSFD